MNPHSIVETVCVQHGMEPSLMRSRRRNRRCVAVRRAIAIELRKHGMSFADIGDFIGGKDESTVRWLVVGRNQ